MNGAIMHTGYVTFLDLIFSAVGGCISLCAHKVECLNFSHSIKLDSEGVFKSIVFILYITKL